MKGIITSDWHLRKDVPPSRTETEEEWINLQFNMVQKVLDFSDENNLDIYHDGDLYHRSQPYYGIISRLIDAFENHIPFLKRLAGNHDLPYNTFENVKNSGWYLSPGVDLTDTEKGAFHYAETPRSKRAVIVFTHQLTFPSEKARPFEGIGKTAQELLDEFPSAKWIFTGDYHKSFHYEKDGRHVVNPGCLTRQSASEASYDTGFYEVDTEAEEVIFHSLEENAPMETKHLDKTKERDSRIDAFIETVEASGKISLSYKENLDKKLAMKGISKGIRIIITEIEEEIGGTK